MQELFITWDHEDGALKAKVVSSSCAWRGLVQLLLVMCRCNAYRGYFEKNQMLLLRWKWCTTQEHAKDIGSIGCNVKSVTRSGIEYVSAV